MDSAEKKGEVRLRMYTYLARFCFAVSVLLIAICLILVPPRAQSDSGAGAFGVGEGSALTNVQFNLGAAAVSVRDSIGSAAMSVANAVLYVPRHVASFVVRVTDVRAFVKPADAMEVPVIVPMQTVAAAPAQPAATVATATPAPAAAPPPSAPPAAVQPAASVATVQSSPSIVNRYARGNCTWWVFQKRAQAGHPIPNSWGNAATWAPRATRDGYTVNHTPSPGAIMQTANSAHGLGHVAFVESADSDGTWHISEMNVVGFNVVSHRTMPPSAAASYNFIHERTPKSYSASEWTNEQCSMDECLTAEIDPGPPVRFTSASTQNDGILNIVHMCAFLTN